MGLFSRRKEPAPIDDGPPVLIAHLAARLLPTHRASVYEDPLEDILARRAPGTKVVGGGTDFSPDDGPLSCDIEIELAGDPERTAAVVVEVLDHLGAPVGSHATLGDGEPIPFGSTHGLALVLDGTGLPESVYADNDVNDLVAAIDAQLDRETQLQSWWEGTAHTSLYYYGPDIDLLHRVLDHAAELSPLATGSRVEPIT